MKCIDAIEGTVKNILNQMHATCVDQCLDDSEYVRTAKAIIEGTRIFITQNPEIVEDPQLVVDVLYAYSRDLWLTAQQPSGPAPTAKSEAAVEDENMEYQTYYYDYLYQRGVYPL